VNPSARTAHIFDSYRKQEIDLASIKAVYFRRPELPGGDLEHHTAGELEFIRREILYTLEGIYRFLQDRFWLSSVYNIRNAENKIYQLIVAGQVGFQAPKSIVTSAPNMESRFLESIKYDAIIKPVWSGHVDEPKNSKIIFTNKIGKDISSQIDRVRACPAYFQQRIYNTADIRATIVGSKIFSCEIHTPGDPEEKVDWRNTDVVELQYKEIDLPKEVSESCLKMLNHFGLEFGAFDFIKTGSGEFIFLEVNPNG